MTSMRSDYAAGLPVFAAIVLTAVVGAQEHEHGAGPVDKVGTVHFANSCSQAAQPILDRTVAFLHSFEFVHAIDGFNQHFPLTRPARSPTGASP